MKGGRKGFGLVGIYYHSESTEINKRPGTTKDNKKQMMCSYSTFAGTLPGFLSIKSTSWANK